MADGAGPAGAPPEAHVEPGESGLSVEARHLRALLTHIDEVIFAYDDEGLITFVSNGVRELMGFEVDEVVGRSVFDYLHPDDGDRLLDNLQRWVGREGATLDENIRVRTADDRWLEVALESVNGDAISPFGAGVATIRSLRESTSIEQQLRQRLLNEDRLIRLARGFVGGGDVGGDEGFEVSVERAMAEMGSLEAVDSIGVWRYQDGLVHHTHQWVAPSISRTLGTWQPFDPEELGLTRALARLEEVALRAGAEPPEELRVEYEGLLARGAQSFLAVPMVTDGEFTGFVSFASHRAENIFAPTHLSTLRAAAGILAGAFARQRAEQELRHQARHDSLTGLANRWAFREHLDAALAATREGASAGTAVLLLDLDRFSVINDALGHAAGDQMLIAIAHRMGCSIRDDEVLARLGGDELIVLLRDIAHPANALERAENLLESFAEPFPVGTSNLRIGASIGVAHRSGTDSEAGGLLREADAAMFAAKARGGRQAYVFDDDLRRRTTIRLDREHDLNGAVERGELELHYQPEYDLRTRSIIGVEALLRWHNPRHGFLTASEFIDVAEDSGLIVDIGYWVIEQGLQQLARWREMGVDPGLVMRINLSARQTAEPNLADQIDELASAAGVDPAGVCFELTETAVMTDAAHTSSVLEQLHGYGFSIAIDDFGTGYSSLAYLRDFPVDVLKIDRSFVTGLGQAADQTLVRAIMSMADALGLHVTAEGIETTEQLDQLLHLGCTHGQGFLLAEPAPADALAPLLGLA